MYTPEKQVASISPIQSEVAKFELKVGAVKRVINEFGLLGL